MTQGIRETLNMNNLNNKCSPFYLRGNSLIQGLNNGYWAWTMKSKVDMKTVPGGKSADTRDDKVSHRNLRRRHSLFDSAASVEDSRKIDQEKLESVMDKIPIQDLDKGERPADNETCIVFGDGLEGHYAVYLAAIDRFVLSYKRHSLGEHNPRQFIPVRKIDS